MSADVFISYVSFDRDRANIIALALQKEGMAVWWDASLLPGQAWDEQILKALKEARIILAIISYGSVKSDFARREWQFAIENGLKIVPVVIGGWGAFESLPVDHGLRQIQAFEFDNTRPDQSATKLARELVRYPGLKPNRRQGPEGESIRRRRRASSARNRCCENRATSRSNPPPAKSDQPPASIFVVHGHDLNMLDAVATDDFRV